MTNRDVTVYEVGPRDGLQNEPHRIPSAVKVRYVDLLSDAGLPWIEVTSFVRPGVIPQLADAEDVATHVSHNQETRYSALVPNIKGIERATHCRLDGIAIFAAASETFSQKNTNGSIRETMDRFLPVVQTARERGLWVRGYVSTAFGCPYEGSVSLDAVTRVTRNLVDLGVDQVAVSDTIGVATPRQVREVVQALSTEIGSDAVAFHFHDTRGLALVNVLAGIEEGIKTFDSSAGGLGGCPYAPGATGNLATEDLIYMLEGMGLSTGISLTKVVAASQFLASMGGAVPASRYYHAANS